MQPTFALDAATWRVHDLERATDFYRRLGFRARPAGAASVDLVPGAPRRRTRPPSCGSSRPGRARRRGSRRLPRRPERPARRDLAATLHRVAADGTPVEGFADHLVSEAMYLPTPTATGSSSPGTARASVALPGWRPGDRHRPLDLRALLAELGDDPEREPHVPEGTVLGHVHLFAADPAVDARWYRDVLGMDEVVSFGPWGTFLAADGYHHHVGLRRGAGPTDPAHDHGLAEVEARVADARYAALAQDEVDGAKVVSAPVGAPLAAAALGAVDRTRRRRRV
jgi:catechol 2,3-dioxygenase